MSISFTIVNRWEVRRMAKFEVIMRNSIPIYVENVDEVKVNNETYFLSKGKGMEEKVIFSAPVGNVYYIRESN